MLITSEKDVVKAGKRAIAIVNTMREFGTSGWPPSVLDLLQWYGEFGRNPDLTMMETGRILMEREEVGENWFQIYVNVS